MKQRVAVLSIVIALTVILSVMTSAGAEAYNFHGCRSIAIANNHPDYYNKIGLSAQWTRAVDGGAGQWNSAPVNGSLNQGGSGFPVQEGNYQWEPTVLALSTWYCTGGYFSSRGFAIHSGNTAWLNSVQRQKVAIHEFGHLMGLWHSSAGCSSALMTSTSGIYCANVPASPRSDDIAGMQALY